MEGMELNVNRELTLFDYSKSSQTSRENYSGVEQHNATQHCDMRVNVRAEEEEEEEGALLHNADARVWVCN